MRRKWFCDDANNTAGKETLKKFIFSKSIIPVKIEERFYPKLFRENNCPSRKAISLLNKIGKYLKGLLFMKMPRHSRLSTFQTLKFSFECDFIELPRKSFELRFSTTS